MKRLKLWWNTERIGRIEEGTSQDICPTNGEAVIMGIIFCAAWLPFIVAFILVK